MSDRVYDLYAVTAHGLAELCATELASIGVAGNVGIGGVSWSGSVRSLYRANLELRTASRVIARVGEFRARGFAELERRVSRLAWNDFLPPDTTVALRVTCRKSKLYHEGAVAERVARVLKDVVGVSAAEDNDAADEADDGTAASDAGDAAALAPDGSRPASNDLSSDDTDSAGFRRQLVIVRFHRDVCTISIDSSGALLHQRGYRQAIAKAPLRETIAAALVLASGWRGDTPLLDPLCGSGTIPIEAALLARGIAPGIANPELAPRAFAFERWSGFDPATWRDVIASARAAVREIRVPIIASDRDAGAIEAARTNAVRAGVERDIEFRRATLVSVDAPPGIGHVVTNPPYGVRVGDPRDLRSLYADLGSIVTTKLRGWSVTLLAADDGLAAATRLPLIERLATRNGGIPVRLLTTTADSVTHKPLRPVYQRAHPEEEKS